MTSFLAYRNIFENLGMQFKESRGHNDIDEKRCLWREHSHNSQDEEYSDTHDVSNRFPTRAAHPPTLVPANRSKYCWWKSSESIPFFLSFSMITSSTANIAYPMIYKEGEKRYPKQGSSIYAILFISKYSQIRKVNITTAGVLVSMSPSLSCTYLLIHRHQSI